MVTVIADTRQGKVRGAEIAGGVIGWRGIPYAAPPVGPLRLRPPRPAEPWSGVRDATEYRAPAAQPEFGADARFGAAYLALTRVRDDGDHSA